MTKRPVTCLPSTFVSVLCTNIVLTQHIKASSPQSQDTGRLPERVYLLCLAGLATHRSTRPGHPRLRSEPRKHPRVSSVRLSQSDGPIDHTVHYCLHRQHCQTSHYRRATSTNLFTVSNRWFAHDVILAYFGQRARHLHPSGSPDRCRNQGCPDRPRRVSGGT